MSIAVDAEEEMYVLSTGKRRQTKVPVLLVGKEEVEARQAQLGILRLAALPWAGVRCAGPPGQIRAVAPSNSHPCNPSCAQFYYREKTVSIASFHPALITTLVATQCPFYTSVHFMILPF